MQATLTIFPRFHNFLRCQVTTKLTAGQENLTVQGEQFVSFLYTHEFMASVRQTTYSVRLLFTIPMIMILQFTILMILHHYRKIKKSKVKYTNICSHISECFGLFMQLKKVQRVSLRKSESTWGSRVISICKFWSAIFRKRLNHRFIILFPKRSTGSVL